MLFLGNINMKKNNPEIKTLSLSQFEEDARKLIAWETERIYKKVRPSSELKPQISGLSSLKQTAQGSLSKIQIHSNAAELSQDNVFDLQAKESKKEKN